jgi:hypothetical protein
MDAKQWISKGVDKDGFQVKIVNPVIGKYLLAKLIINYTSLPNWQQSTQIGTNNPSPKSRFSWNLC